MIRCDFCTSWRPKINKVGDTLGFKCVSSCIEKDCQEAMQLMIKTLSSGSKIYLNADKVK